VTPPDADDTDTATSVPEESVGASDTEEAATEEGAVLDELFAVIEERRETLPEGSYTASLFTHEKGENKVLEKLGEETTEVLLAAKDDDNEALAGEAADLVYHLLVLLATKDMTLADLRAELRERR
jgi:phosphoribosyl-ATP pyrophosphohydrolase